jgi:aminoglycoside phosphotransferase (APT) family kinase protein
MGAGSVKEGAREYSVVAKRGHLDPEAVRAALERWLPARLDFARELRVSPLAANSGTGIANETLLCEAEWREGRSSRRAGFVVRVATDDPLYLDADLSRHAGIYRALAGTAVPVPKVIGEETEPSILGSPFFVMQRVEGRVPPDTPHYTLEGWVKEASTAERQAMWRSVVETVAALHRLDVERFAFLRRPEAGSSGLEQDLAYWSRYLAWAEEGRENPTLRRGLEWLRAARPGAAQTSFSWGDFRINNVIFEGSRVAAILDWDSASLAGPEADLAWWIISAGHNPARLEGFGSSDDLLDLWESLVGRPVQDLRYWLVYAAFRLGCIVMKLGRQMGRRGLQSPDKQAAMTEDSVYMQDLALLLGFAPPGPVRVTLPSSRRL